MAKKTVAGVTTQYYGFAGYCGSYYADVDQPNSALNNLTFFTNSSVQYFTNVTGTPLTRLTALNPGTYRISGTLDFVANEAIPATPISLSGTAPLDPTYAPVSSVTGSVSSASGTGASQNITLSGDPETITVNGQTITISGQTVTISGQTADLSGVVANLSGASLSIPWSSIALERYVTIILKKNGSAVSFTGRQYKIIGDYGRTIATVDYLIYLEKNDYVELQWSGTDPFGVRDSNVYMLCNGGIYPSALINMTMVR